MPDRRANAILMAQEQIATAIRLLHEAHQLVGLGDAEGLILRAQNEMQFARVSARIAREASYAA